MGWWGNGAFWEGKTRTAIQALVHAAAAVAAYRDRHGVTDSADPFGEPHGGGQWIRRADRRRAQAAATEARRLAVGTIRRQRPADHGQRAEPELRPDL